MKFYKRENLSKINPMDNSLSYQVDGRIDTKSSVSLQLPVGTVEQRPTVLRNGEIRYNVAIGSGVIEAYIDGSWEIIKTNVQQIITQQTFTNSNYLNTIFGPLSYDININNPQNVMVYVDNVYQIPTTDYSLARSTSIQPITTSTVLSQSVSSGATIIPLQTVKNFNVGQAVNGTYLSGNIIVNVDHATPSITISPGTFGSISIGGSIQTYFSPGTFIIFSEDSVPTPTKPITSFLGFDGYNPPFEV